MAEYYKLDRVRELADGDQDFIVAIVATFIEEVPADLERLKVAVPNNNYKEAYQAAHKMKPTIDLFELGIYDTLIEVQDWGKFEQTDRDVTEQLQALITAIDNAIEEMQTEFGL